MPTARAVIVTSIVPSVHRPVDALGAAATGAAWRVTRGSSLSRTATAPIPTAPIVGPTTKTRPAIPSPNAHFCAFVLRAPAAGGFGASNCPNTTSAPPKMANERKSAIHPGLLRTARTRASPVSPIAARAAPLERLQRLQPLALLWKTPSYHSTRARFPSLRTAIASVT
jgi:hypothetical protein